MLCSWLFTFLLWVTQCRPFLGGVWRLVRLGGKTNKQIMTCAILQRNILPPPIIQLVCLSSRPPKNIHATEDGGCREKKNSYQAASCAVYEVSGIQESVVRAWDTCYLLSPALLMMLYDLTSAERVSPAMPRKSSFAFHKEIKKVSIKKSKKVRKAKNFGKEWKTQQKVLSCHTIKP